MRVCEESRVQPLTVFSYRRDHQVILPCCLGQFHPRAWLLSSTARLDGRGPGRRNHIGAGHRQDGEEGRSPVHGVGGNLWQGSLVITFGRLGSSIGLEVLLGYSSYCGVVEE